MSGGSSVVVLFDFMLNLEVKCCSVDGSVGFFYVRVGNCQVLNKMKGLVERLGFLFYLLFVGELD